MDVHDKGVLKTNSRRGQSAARRRKSPMGVIYSQPVYDSEWNEWLSPPKPKVPKTKKWTIGPYIWTAPSRYQSADTSTAMAMSVPNHPNVMDNIRYSQFVAAYFAASTAKGIPHIFPREYVKCHSVEVTKNKYIDDSDIQVGSRVFTVRSNNRSIFKNAKPPTRFRLIKPVSHEPMLVKGADAEHKSPQKSPILALATPDIASVDVTKSAIIDPGSNQQRVLASNTVHFDMDLRNADTLTTIALPYSLKRDIYIYNGPNNPHSVVRSTVEFMDLGETHINITASVSRKCERGPCPWQLTLSRLPRIVYIDTLNIPDNDTGMGRIDAKNLVIIMVSLIRNKCDSFYQLNIIDLCTGRDLFNRALPLFYKDSMLISTRKILRAVVTSNFSDAKSWIPRNISKNMIYIYLIACDGTIDETLISVVHSVEATGSNSVFAKLLKHSTRLQSPTVDVYRRQNYMLKEYIPATNLILDDIFHLRTDSRSFLVFLKSTASIDDKLSVHLVQFDHGIYSSDVTIAIRWLGQHDIVWGGQSTARSLSKCLHDIVKQKVNLPPSDLAKFIVDEHKNIDDTGALNHRQSMGVMTFCLNQLRSLNDFAKALRIYSHSESNIMQLATLVVVGLESMRVIENVLTQAHPRYDYIAQSFYAMMMEEVSQTVSNYPVELQEEWQIQVGGYMDKLTSEPCVYNLALCSHITKILWNQVVISMATEISQSIDLFHCKYAALINKYAQSVGYKGDIDIEYIYKTLLWVEQLQCVLSYMTLVIDTEYTPHVALLPYQEYRTRNTISSPMNKFITVDITKGSHINQIHEHKQEDNDDRHKISIPNNSLIGGKLSNNQYVTYQRSAVDDIRPKPWTIIHGVDQHICNKTDDSEVLSGDASHNNDETEPCHAPPTAETSPISGLRHMAAINQQKYPADEVVESSNRNMKVEVINKYMDNLSSKVQQWFTCLYFIIESVLGTL